LEKKIPVFSRILPKKFLYYSNNKNNKTWKIVIVKYVSVELVVVVLVAIVKIKNYG